MANPKMPKGKMVKVAVFIIIVLMVFFAGYQFAIYQKNAGDNLLPHFNIGTPKTSSCFGLPECGFQCPTSQPCAHPDKPVIYLYPTKNEIINVKVGYKAGISKSSPLYNPIFGWNILAHPNGGLTNLADHNDYSYLYWEGNPESMNFNMDEGFVISGKNTDSFLKQELTKIGLNSRESADFVSYWGPIMGVNSFNLIHFAQGSEYTSKVKLTISPKPESLLRVFMVYKSLKNPISVVPEIFPSFDRSGFTVVEWGGSELNN
ncbi:MAG TPA: hypothetical protein VMR18_02195 [Candidatus Saccharimonadales bacterium]|jgi:hypothetical protein|nr:hypothetical protein [Candidatus Saccharimonadales bacterium]